MTFYTRLHSLFRTWRSPTFLWGYSRLRRLHVEPSHRREIMCPHSHSGLRVLGWFAGRLSPFSPTWSPEGVDSLTRPRSPPSRRGKDGGLGGGGRAQPRGRTSATAAGRPLVLPFFLEDQRHQPLVRWLGSDQDFLERRSTVPVPRLAGAPSEKTVEAPTETPTLSLYQRGPNVLP